MWDDRRAAEVEGRRPSRQLVMSNCIHCIYTLIKQGRGLPIAVRLLLRNIPGDEGPHFPQILRFCLCNGWLVSVPHLFGALSTTQQPDNWGGAE